MLTESEIDLYSLYRDYPDEWIRKVLGAAALEDYQVNILQEINQYDRIAIKATHSVGKTWLMARAALWFFNIFPNSIVITTAPTHRQVKALLWGEIRDAFKSAPVPLGGRLLDTELKLNDKHYMMGFSPKATAGTGQKEQQGSSFQGFHSDHVLVLFDEATGVSHDVWVMAEGLLTSGKMVKFVAIANPTTRNCEFFKCFSDPSWRNIKISCFDSPNMIANGLTNKESLQDEIDRLSVLNDEERLEKIQGYQKPVPYLLTAQFVVPYVMKLGKDHPLVKSKVFGEFPDNDENVLVQYEDVVQAVARDVPLDLTAQRLIGVDVARMGSDKSVITELRGFKHVDTQKFMKRELTYLTGAVINKINEDQRSDTIVCIDATGMGAGVYDNLIEAQREKRIGKNVTIVEVNFGASPNNSDASKEEQDQDRSRYFNLKAKMFDLLASDLKEKIDLQDESIYFEELPSIQFRIDSKGRTVIESKVDYKKRTGRSSPDESDSLALANYGRYVIVKHGTFTKKEKSQPLVKRAKKTDRKSGIKVREY